MQLFLVSEKFKYIFNLIIDGDYMAKSKVSAKWLTTIPKEVREFLGLNIGDTLIWKLIKNGQKKFVIIEKEVDPYEALKGIRNNPELTFEKVKHLADEIIRKMAGH